MVTACLSVHEAALGHVPAPSLVLVTTHVVADAAAGAAKTAASTVRSASRRAMERPSQIAGLRVKHGWRGDCDEVVTNPSQSLLIRV
jgi:hypothetical protein